MFSIDEFVGECLDAVRREGVSGDRRCVRSSSAPCRSRAAIIDAIGEPSAAPLFSTWHTSDELTVLHVVWPPTVDLMPHDHMMWASIGLYGGREDNRFFRVLPRWPAREPRRHDAARRRHRAARSGHDPRGRQSLVGVDRRNPRVRRRLLPTRTAALARRQAGRSSSSRPGDGGARRRRSATPDERRSTADLEPRAGVPRPRPGGSNYGAAEGWRSGRPRLHAPS